MFSTQGAKANQAWRRVFAALAVLGVAAAGCSAPTNGATPVNQRVTSSVATQIQPAGAIPRPDHVVVVVMENHGLDQVIGNPNAPYINQLARTGAQFTNATAITHPSEPNYLALFSGDTFGVTDDSCPHSFSAPNLGERLLDAHLSFAGYSENQPSVGYTGCEAGNYARKHNPWVNFTNVPTAANQSFSGFGPDYAALPTVSIVVPNLCNDMHDCGVRTGDTWIKSNLDGFARWAQTHNSLLVVTWDEAEDASPNNQIPLIFAGAIVKAGRYSEPVNHYRLLRTLEDFYHLTPTGQADATSAITDVWTQ
ncbi:MAG: phosphatidylinositol-3-phosphatase [Actinomycetota bacterium]|jgi:acid phosphatase|nr:phosphatidylinositol-3-phosphatase [Actinomycetota bacterium]